MGILHYIWEQFIYLLHRSTYICLCYTHYIVCIYTCVTNLGVIWLDPHNFLLWSHGRLLSMKSLVRVLPAAAYTFNMVPIYDPGGPNPHGRVWGPFPVPVRDFTLRSHYPREAGLPKPDSDPAPDSLGIGLSPNSSQKYTVLYLELIRSLLDPFQGSHTIIGTSDSFRLPLTHSELPWLGLSLGMFHKVHGPVPWTNPCTIRSFSGAPHYYWDVGLLETPSDSLGITLTWAITRNAPQSTRSCTLN